MLQKLVRIELSRCRKDCTVRKIAMRTKFLCICLASCYNPENFCLRPPRPQGSQDIKLVPRFKN